MSFSIFKNATFDNRENQGVVEQKQIKSYSGFQPHKKDQNSPGQHQKQSVLNPYQWAFSRHNKNGFNPQPLHFSVNEIFNIITHGKSPSPKIVPVKVLQRTPLEILLKEGDNNFGDEGEEDKSSTIQTSNSAINIIGKTSYDKPMIELNKSVKKDSERSSEEFVSSEEISSNEVPFKNADTLSIIIETAKESTQNSKV
mmetsp:Transcript_31446/g.27804  ORF Transcript_31446/g.27804 Transcript_31446/m.27804 type:complete len:198 (+) Transcript_31446:15-608(+)